jgi:hypothetical protein
VCINSAIVIELNYKSAKSIVTLTYSFGKESSSGLMKKNIVIKGGKTNMENK